MPPRMGANQNSHNCCSASPPTTNAGPVLRAGFTEVLVTGMLIRWMSVSAEADGDWRKAGWCALVGRSEDDDQETCVRTSSAANPAASE